MKKAISILLSFILIFSVVSVSITTYAEEIIEERDINNFINGIVELSREYDEEKDFVPVDEEDEATATLFFSNGETTQQETDSLDFQTARLIVRSDGDFNTYGAVEHVRGFKDFHILQYDSPEDAKSAYGKYTYDSDIISVSPDEVAIFSTLTEESASNNEVAKLNDWSLQRTQSKRLQDYLSTSDIEMEEVVVAVVDTGLDYNHEFFEGRIERTYFNSSFDGTTDDEMDVEISHGTSVASVVINNSFSNVLVAGYKVLSNDSTATELMVSAGILKAIEDEVDVINLSIHFTKGDNELCIAALEDAFENNIPVVCAAGNSGNFQTIFCSVKYKRMHYSFFNKSE